MWKDFLSVHPACVGALSSLLVPCLTALQAKIAAGQASSGLAKMRLINIVTITTKLVDGAGLITFYSRITPAPFT